MKLKAHLFLYLLLLLMIFTGQPQIIETILTPDDIELEASFGKSVAIYGEFAVIGVPYDEAVYIYKEVAQYDWQKVATLTSGDTALQLFGHKVALYDDLLAVGAPSDNYMPDVKGSVYLFRRISDSNWNLEAELQAVDGFPADRFGSSVSTDGSHVIVGSGIHSTNPQTGSAYVFKKIEGAWSQLQKLDPPGLQTWDHYGQAVTIDGNYAAVGAPWDSQLSSTAGRVYIYVRDQNTGFWLLSDQLTPTGVTDKAQFGSALDILGSKLCIGARGDRTANPIGDSPIGSVYLFSLSGISWNLDQKLFPPSPLISGHFGTSVALSKERVLIGADLDNTLGEWDGLAYLYNNSSGSWQLESQLSPGDYAQISGNVTMSFGNSVDIHERQMIVGRDPYWIGPPWAANIYQIHQWVIPYVRLIYYPLPIPSTGGDVEYLINYQNVHDADVRFTRTVTLLFPDGSEDVLQAETSFLAAAGETLEHNERLVVEADWPAGEYQLQLSWEDESGSFTESAPFEKSAESSRKQDNAVVPDNLALSNYPNPFNPSTTIQYSLPEDGRVELRIYSTTGQLVRTVIDEAQSSGNYTADWDGRNEGGQLVASGIYIYRLISGKKSIARQMFLTR